MATTRPLAAVSGSLREIPDTDKLPAAIIPVVVDQHIHAATSKATPDDADELGYLDSAASFGLVKWTYSQFKAWLRSLFREKLTAARTYYVRTDGSDSNTGLSNTAGGAFATIQKAIDVSSKFDLNGFNVTINVAAGTYAGNIVCRPFVGEGVIEVIGNIASPTSVTLQDSSGVIVNFPDPTGIYSFQGFRVSGSGCIGFVSSRGARLTFGAIDFGSLIYAIFALEGGVIDMSTSCVVSGSMDVFAYGISHSRVFIEPSATITLIGTPNFVLGFAGADRGALVTIYGVTFSGSATGKRYFVESNALVFSNGAGPNYYPGNAAGTIATGGQYI